MWLWQQWKKGMGAEVTTVGEAWPDEAEAIR
jgi:hypothetical protein